MPEITGWQSLFATIMFGGALQHAGSMFSSKRPSWESLCAAAYAWLALTALGFWPVPNSNEFLWPSLVENSTPLWWGIAAVGALLLVGYITRSKSSKLERKPR